MTANGILFLSDNPAIMDGMVAFARTQPWFDRVRLACTPGGPLAERPGIWRVRLKDKIPPAPQDWMEPGIVDRYGLIVSGHCKQIFPREIIDAVPCVNLHPGFNPETRGWYPQVFAIHHRRKIGFTVHVMDAEIDHGPIIHREEVEAFPWDTSKSLYDRVVAAEIASLPKWLPALVAGETTTTAPESEGHYASKQDFRDICEMDLNQTGTFREFYDQLRATSFAPHRNAWFTEPESGKKVYVRLEIETD